MTLTAQEAVDYGLADRVITTRKAARPSCSALIIGLDHWA